MVRDQSCCSLMRGPRCCTRASPSFPDSCLLGCDSTPLKTRIALRMVRLVVLLSRLLSGVQSSLARRRAENRRSMATVWGLAGLSGGKWASEGWSAIVSRLTLMKINVVNWRTSPLRSVQATTAHLGTRCRGQGTRPITCGRLRPKLMSCGTKKRRRVFEKWPRMPAQASTWPAK